MIYTSKPFINSIIYYIIAIGVVCSFRFSPSFRTGMCGPNLDLISLVVAVFISIILMIIVLNMYTLNKTKTNLWLVWLHLIGLGS